MRPSRASRSPGEIAGSTATPHRRHRRENTVHGKANRDRQRRVLALYQRNIITGTVYWGIYNNDSSPTIIGNTITGNGSYGILNYNKSSPRINDNVITGNKDAGIANSTSCSPDISGTRSTGAPADLQRRSICGQDHREQDHRKCSCGIDNDASSSIIIGTRSQGTARGSISRTPDRHQRKCYLGEHQLRNLRRLLQRGAITHNTITNNADPTYPDIYVETTCAPAYQLQPL